ASRPPPLSPLVPYTTLFRSRFRSRFECVQLMLERRCAVDAAAILLFQGLSAHVSSRNGRLRRDPSHPGSRAYPGGRTGHDHIIRSEEHTSELQSRENLVCRL